MIKIEIKKIMHKFNINSYDAALKAISIIKKNNGGTLIFNKGIYSLGYIELCSNINIHLNKGAVISPIDDFNLLDKYHREKGYLNRPTWENCDYDGNPSMFFLYAKNKKNIKITGSGIINGREKMFYGKVMKDAIEGAFYPRMPLIYFEGCKNIIIKNITLKKSAFWTIHLVGSKNILIRNIKIRNNIKMLNCDGIDPDSSQNIIIDNVDIVSADDSIVIKSTKYGNKYGNSKNIYVRNSKLQSTSAAIKIGTETVGSFNNITFENIDIHDSNRGISIQSRDCGNINNLLFKNINIDTHRYNPLMWWGKGEGIAITSVNRYEDTILGKIKNISFENININSENGIYINSLNNIKNINFNNVYLYLNKKTNYNHHLYDLRPYYKINEPIKDNLYLFNSNGVKKININNFKYDINDNIKKLVKDIYKIIK